MKEQIYLSKDPNTPRLPRETKSFQACIVYIHEIKSCVRGDHQSHILARIDRVRAFPVYYTRAHTHIHKGRHAVPLIVSRVTRRVRPCFVSIAQIMPDGERTPHAGL